MKLIAYIDGASRYNPGPAGIGVCIFDDQGKILKEVSEFLGEATNNVAEWSAYIRALEASRDLRGSELIVFTDSQLLCEQVRGSYKVREPRLQVLYKKAKGLEKLFNKVSVTLIPREKNKLADRLAKRAAASKELLN